MIRRLIKVAGKWRLISGGEANGLTCGLPLLYVISDAIDPVEQVDGGPASRGQSPVRIGKIARADS